LEEYPLDLTSIGWNSRLASEFEALARPELVPARVSVDTGRIWTVLADVGELAAEVSGRFRDAARSRSDFPAVGDWVAVAPRPAEGAATIHALLPRRGVVSRKNAGPRAEEQVLAAHVDTVLIVSGLDGDFNPRRIERLLAMAWSSGASPAIVLNKADACDDPQARLAEVELLAPAVPVVLASAVRGDGVEAVRSLLGPGRTAVLVGSSGVGKSTLVNALAGRDSQDTREVREDDSRGRHTTSRRDLFVLPGGAVLIDSPGLREVGLWGAEEGIAETFADIEALASGCRFADCRHDGEPGCAVRRALVEGRLEQARYESRQKLQRELAWVEARGSELAMLEQKRRQRLLSRAQKRFKKDRPRP
jgi:ribosome biogenesis GTPase / thiamine phosphate phosphatase